MSYLPKANLRYLKYFIVELYDFGVLSRSNTAHLVLPSAMYELHIA